jgi:hypothetical protein
VMGRESTAFETYLCMSIRFKLIRRDSAPQPQEIYDEIVKS